MDIKCGKNGYVDEHEETSDSQKDKKRWISGQESQTPFKRSRKGTGNELEPSASATAATKSPQNQTKLLNVPVVHSAIFSPQSFAASNGVKLGEFLKRCYNCKKRIPGGADVFMYRDFCAFCSVGCRAIQISVDKLAAKQLLRSKEIKDVKNHCQHW